MSNPDGQSKFKIELKVFQIPKIIVIILNCKLFQGGQTNLKSFDTSADQ